MAFVLLYPSYFVQMNLLGSHLDLLRFIVTHHLSCYLNSLVAELFNCLGFLHLNCLDLFR